MTTFYDFNLSEKVNLAIQHMGFEEMTAIQAQAIPAALLGHDIIGQAQTGTGKTVAFGIPLVEHMELNTTSNTQALVITPTRELAIQVAEELNRIGQFKGIRTLPIYGGQDINRQIRSLKKKPHIIVGTPGRLMDHMRRKTIRLGDLKTAVLDEADEMLNMGFIEDIEKILSEVPEERQTLLFSATMPIKIQNLANKFMKNPKIIKIKTKEMTVPNIDQNYIEIHEKQKFDALCRLLDIQSPEMAIIFGRTKRRVDELSEALNKRGYSADGIHGDLTQSKRDSVMNHFKSGQIDVLVATDVAARGLDISGVTHVYNFDIPQDPESYVHRIGRTGRAGKTGFSVTFVTHREIDHLKTIERQTKRKMSRMPVPSITEAIEGQQRLAMEKLLSTAESKDIQKYNSLAEHLLDQSDSITLLSAALKLLTKEPDSTPVQLTSEAPAQRKRMKNKRPNKKIFRHSDNRDHQNKRGSRNKNSRRHG